MRRTFYKFTGVFIVSLIVVISGNNVNAGSSSADSLTSKYQTFNEKAEKGVKDPITGYHISWKEGFRLVSPKKNLKVKIGGKLIVDGGNIDADDELQRAFPDLDGSDIDFRNLSVDIFGTIYDKVDFRLEIDFANARDIKDNWIRFSNNPYLKHIKFGHMKEPFSLEEQTGINSITFMERALPVLAFSQGRNIGIRYDHPLSNIPINGSAGIFLNTGSFGNLGEGNNQLSDANGINLTARFTGTPWYEEAGRKLLHFGLSYTHGFRDENDIQFRARPESRLTDVRLVDTGKFQADGIDKIGTEVAVVSGPLSFQGECFYALTDSASKDDPEFWGAYAYLSYFITGEHRIYKRSAGTFSLGEQNYRFDPLKREWGAWELGMRYSYVDLNDADIKGGKERNFTASVNWYHRKNIRVMLNYILANVKDKESPLIENGRTNIFQTRLQIIF
jgi:phosphate-selective porin OprO and OprP